MLIAAKYRKTWNIHKIQKGWGRFDVIWGGWRALGGAAKAAARFPTPAALVLALAHSSADGQIQFVPDKPQEHSLAEVRLGLNLDTAVDNQ
jgi:hypothetical protein